MTILFAGGEDTSFTYTGGTVSLNNTAASIIRSTYSRASIQITGSTADPPANRATPPAFTASADLWFHGRIGWGGGTNGTTANSVVFRLLDGGTARILVRGTGTAGQLKISTRNAAGTITDLVTSSSGNFSTAGTGTANIDLHVVYSASGSATLYIDGTSIATFSGDVTTNSATTLDQFDLGAGITSTAWFWSELIAADEDTRAMALWTLAPQASGNSQGWTPNTVGNINEIVLSDATLVSTGSNNTLSQWTTPTSPPSGAWGVKAIVQEARVQVGATGPQHFDWSLRTASTDFTAGASLAPGTSFGNFGNQIWATNPNTSAAWAIGDIAAGFNLGIKALA